MSNQESLLSVQQIDFEDIDISPSDIFDLDNSIIAAKETLQMIADNEYDYRYKSHNVIYEENSWVFNYIPEQTNVTLDFDNIKPYFDFSDKSVSNIIVDVLKCWVANIIKDYSPKTAKNHLRSLKHAIIVSNGFSPEFLDDFIDMVNERILKRNDLEHTLTEHMTHRLIVAITNFGEYYPSENIDVYNENLIHVRKPHIEKNYRILPSAKDVYKFSYYLDTWYQETFDDPEELDSFIHYYPIYLWWKLTSIIPMRPSEFANIERNCLSIQNNQTYIKLPRGKQKNPKKVQIPDVLHIPKNLYDSISNYIKLTNNMGETETLISYRSIRNCAKNKGIMYKYIKDRTNKSIIYYLLKDFYKEILNQKHNLSVNFDDDYPDSTQDSYDINRRLRIIDSRHISIISLMLQGYDKIEVARLAGHTSLSVQYDYFNHVRFWVDSEVKRLSEEFGLKTMDNLNHLFFNHPEADDKIESFMIDSWENGKIGEGLKLGYCTDEDMSCPVGFHPEFSGCYYCPFWKIEQEELMQNKKLIKSEISIVRDDLTKCTNFLLQLHEKSEIGATGDVNPDLKNDLKSTSKEVQSKMIQAAKLEKIKNLLRGVKM